MHGAGIIAAMSTRSVYRYWPNLVDYLRLLLFAVFLLLAFHHPLAAGLFYILCAALDGIDGVLARKLQQISHLGTALDFAIDRVTSASLLLILSQLYPNTWLLWCALMILDLGSHFMHLYSATTLKAENHKKLSHFDSRLLTIYYTHRPTLFWLCFFYEAFLLSLYLYHYFPCETFLISCLLFSPGFLCKAWIHLLQIRIACRHLAQS